ncbi:hypothetical protein RhiirA5_424938 [Rhizophagus irregularis]|uniref:Uncharacterized protein n=1 Tax=Rhizophagus irregularis TaxID=588596 RepID=A0A2I1EZ59_9GLOM|nr:hypothetical protein RhiirA5_424938 [Rhizophagus irregularis]PKY27403.1 hypothetical protein RhiirB3_443105 [Rhizophagus irregularis]
MIERAYKIKNLLKTLSTYDTLFKRKVNMIDSDICARCEKEVKSWWHILKCECSEVTIRELILNAIVSFEENFIIKGMKYKRRTREWELLRGVFNTNTKVGNKVIFELLVYYYDQIRIQMRLKRSEEVTEIERKKGITKGDERMRIEGNDVDSNNIDLRSIENNKIEENNIKNQKK